MLFNKKFRKFYNSDSYKKFIEKLLVDEKIREEVLNQIKLFEDEGQILFDGNNLYGKMISKKSTTYLEIRYDANGFVCNYIKWSGGASVKLTQNDLKQGNTKVEREEVVDYISDDKHNHCERVETVKKVYDKNNKVIYEETYEENRDYDSYKNGLTYTEGCFTNDFELERKWYISNGSIIQYNLSKNYFYDQTDLEEGYNICVGPEKRPYEGLYYYFSPLSQDLFKLFMTGEISIEKLLDEHQKQNQEKKQKRI